MTDVIATLPNGWVSIQYELGEAPFVWRDSISGPPEVIDAMTQPEIESEKQRRYQSWIAIVSAQTVEGE